MAPTARARGRGMQRSALLATALLIAVSAACLAVLLSSGRAEASFPGKNGFYAFTGRAPDGSPEIFRVRPDGSSLKQLTNAAGSSYNPSWSPDGTKIVFQSDRHGQDPEVYVKDLTNGKVSRITHTFDGLQRPTWLPDDRDPSWSPDGSKILFVTWVANEECSEIATSGIYVMDADGSDQKLLVGNDCPFYDSPEWSPDGSKIAFSSAYYSSYNIFTINPDGSGLKNLTRYFDSSSNQDFDWSPNGKKIVWGKRTADAETGNIWKMNADGSQKDRLTFHPDAIEDFPVWSPNGRKILFNRCCGSSENEGLMMMNVDGTNKTNIPDLPGVVGMDWQPIPTP
jgi:TolB protein